jgi:exonuclease SbcC
LLDGWRAKLDETKSLIATLKTRLESIDAVIEATGTAIQALDNREAQLSVKFANIADWKYLADMLAANHLPAMELDAVLDAIDSEATRVIAPYREGRYMYRSLTQQDGKSSVIDKFDIMVHDGETGEDKSLLKHSVGEKSFLSDAYVKALIKIRQSRSKTAYNPVISDEADSFIEIPAIPSYYEMQGNYYSDGSRVLIVSHSPDAGNYIQNKVDMTEVLV